jgi:hypothetical protein
MDINLTQPDVVQLNQEASDMHEVSSLLNLICQILPQSPWFSPVKPLGFTGVDCFGISGFQTATLTIVFI